MLAQGLSGALMCLNCVCNGVKQLLKFRMGCPVLLVGLSLAAQVITTQAHPLPEGTLHIVVGFQAGGSSGRMACIVADELKDQLGVPVPRCRCENSRS